jgi:hypothetical protein
MRNGKISPARRRGIAAHSFGLQINTKQRTPFRFPETTAG